MSNEQSNAELSGKVARARSRTLTARQQDLLWIVQQYGPITVSDVARHLLMDYPQAYGVLSRLERRALIEATYTNLRAGYCGRGFVITETGTQAVSGYVDALTAAGADEL